MLKSPLFWKITTLIGCIVLLSLPLMMVRSLLMSERIIVAKWWTPLSKAPAARKTRRTADRYSDNRDPDPHGEPKEVNYQRSWVYYWLPESLAVTGKQTVESRRVGIYSGQSGITPCRLRPRLIRCVWRR